MTAVENSSNESALTGAECHYTITPLDSMEFIQQNFAKYKDGDRAAAEFIGQHDRIPLSKRFTLLERGFVLQLKEDAPRRRSHFHDVKCVLKCDKPVYAKETTKKRKNNSNRGDFRGRAAHHGNNGSTAAKPASAAAPEVPLAQMQNLQVAH